MTKTKVPIEHPVSAFLMLLAVTGSLLTVGQARAEEPGLTPYEAVVESEQQTTVTAQVSGAVTAIEVHPGDRVHQGQVLIRLDGDAARQAQAASQAQLLATQAERELASHDIERQRQLFEAGYISPAAFDRAQAHYRSATAETEARRAQAQVTQTQSGYYVLRAPFDGVVSEVPASLGDMAQPGKPLVSLYDPAHMRVTATLPQTDLTATPLHLPVRIEIPHAGQSPWVDGNSVRVLPAADPLAHTVQIRIGLPDAATAWVPGGFARVWLPSTIEQTHQVLVPEAAVVRRAEMTGLYVYDAKGHPLLRQVRLGRAQGDRIEILSGLDSGERYAPDAQAALSAGR